ncbi:MAG: MFS transporter [Chloroflexota bacterium]|nr:MAG: MFS transporter [Chloroflexota bacterium]
MTTDVRPILSGRQSGLLIASLMLGTALAALDVTIVGTALPTIVASLGGVDLYAWVITVYLLTSTVTVPMYGRLSDIVGRKPIYLSGIIVFLIGSVACGLAPSMEFLIGARALQGIGAGALLPMSMTIIGDTFTVEERARVQAFIVSVWGVSSVAGPAAGAFIIGTLPWGWVFLINLPVGVVAMAMLLLNYREKVSRRRQSIDWLGTILLTVGVTILLFGLQDGASARSAILLVIAIAILATFAVVETRVASPIVPLSLLRVPVIGIGYLASVLLGIVQFGVSSFVPLYVQGAMGGTVISVGAVVTPMAIGWPIGSLVAGKLIVKRGYRPILLAGMSSIVVGTLALLLLTPNRPLAYVFVTVGIIGLGMGLTNPPIIIAFQNAVAWNQRGIVTSLGQFFRSIGGSVGVAGMGALINAGLTSRLGPAFDSGGRAIDAVNRVLDPTARSALAPDIADQVRDALAGALWTVYTIPAACGVIGLVLIARFFPVGLPGHLAAGGAASAKPAPAVESG